MSSTRNPGRVAGLWYLLLIAISPLFLIYIPNKLFVTGNAAATVNNLAVHERLFRFGILAELVGDPDLPRAGLVSVIQGRGPVSRRLVVILGGVMPAVIYFVNVVSNLGALMLVRGADFLSVFDKGQRDALAMLFLRLHSYQIDASLLLAGTWLFPLAVLVYRSRFLPRFIGVWLAIGGIGWLILCFTTILAPEYQDKIFAICQPAFFGEIVLMLWLVVKGSNPPALDNRALIVGG